MLFDRVTRFLGVYLFRHLILASKIHVPQVIIRKPADEKLNRKENWKETMQSITERRGRN